MSWETWKAEFYPIPINKTDAEDALEHSIRKWTGLLPANLKKHNMEVADGTLYEEGNRRSGLIINFSSCALCEHFDCLGEEWDPTCPLEIAGHCCELENSVYMQWAEGKVGAQAMLTALKGAREEE